MNDKALEHSLRRQEKVAGASFFNITHVKK